MISRLGLQKLCQRGLLRATVARAMGASADATSTATATTTTTTTTAAAAPPAAAFRSFGTSIQRYQDVDHPNTSQIVIHNGVVYISAQVDASAGPENIEGQTRDVLAKVDELLEEAGTTRCKLLTANVWLKNIERDFGAVNALWNEWQDAENKPVRATVETNMVNPNVLVEVQVTASLM